MPQGLSNSPQRNSKTISSVPHSPNFDSYNDIKLYTELKLLAKVDYLTKQLYELQKKVDEFSSSSTINQDKLVYTRKEVCEIFKTNYQTLYNWDKANILKPKKIGDRVYYTIEDINKALIRE